MADDEIPSMGEDPAAGQESVGLNRPALQGLTQIYLRALYDPSPLPPDSLDEARRLLTTVREPE